MSPGFRTAAVIAALSVPALAIPALPASAAPRCVNGSAGLGDPYFRYAGNGGYDVTHYGIDLRYDPASRHLAATTRVTATATLALCRFDLDFRGLTVRALTVDGRPASYTRRGVQELVVTLARPLPKGSRFTVVVSYDGQPRPVIDPDGSLDGWAPTKDGAFVASEPQGSPSWYPCNDNPRDKATFDVRATVPAGTVAVGNGDLVRRSTARGRTTFTWRNRAPMPTYLSTITIGRFQVTRGRTPDGIPFYNAVDPREARQADPVLAKLPAIVDFYRSVFGPYPWPSVGAIVDHAPRVGYALETATRPVFASAPSEETLAHELAHQWFGDSVTLRTWPQIWLNEGFATWSEWFWQEHRGGPSVQQVFDRLYAKPASSGIWNPPPGRPGSPANLFAGSVYVRGGMTLQALRVRIGDADFRRLLRAWATRHRHGTATIGEFEALAQRVSGRHLQHFFDVWLRTPGKPRNW